MLSGDVDLYDGRSWIRAGPGDFCYGPREHYFETLARGEAMTEEQRAAFMLRHAPTGCEPGRTLEVLLMAS